MSRAETASTAARPEWAKARRIVVKIGSSLLVDHARGELNAAWLESLAADIAALVKAGKQVIVVSSGAIALGRHVLSLPRGELPLEQSQAAAAVGQISLASAYQAILGAHGLTAAQILLTLGDTEERRRYLNARQTIATLLAQRAVPVVNENDTVATTEIRYGDNDRLSARVASMMSADCLVLLSDIDGLYTAPPGSGIDRAAPRRGAPDHARDRGHGRQRRHRAVARRHGDQDRGGPHRAGLRHQHGDHLGQGPASLARAVERRAVHLVPGAVRSGHRAQALDRRPARAQGRRADRRRRGEGAAVGQEPAARRRAAVEGAFERGDCRRHPRRRRP